MSDEQKSYVYFGNQLVEFLSEATIFGKRYYDIRLQNGIRKTVPASSCSMEQKRVEKEKDDNNNL